jgi:hypothetical protein
MRAVSIAEQVEVGGGQGDLVGRRDTRRDRPEGVPRASRWRT